MSIWRSGESSGPPPGFAGGTGRVKIGRTVGWSVKSSFSSSESVSAAGAAAQPVVTTTVTSDMGENKSSENGGSPCCLVVCALDVDEEEENKGWSMPAYHGPSSQLTYLTDWSAFNGEHSKWFYESHCLNLPTATRCYWPSSSHRLNLAASTSQRYSVSSSPTRPLLSTC